MSTWVFHRLGQGVEHMCVCEGREGASGDIVGGREPQGMLWVGGSLRGYCGWEGASGGVVGRREPQGMLQVEGSLLCVYVILCTHVHSGCGVCVCVYACVYAFMCVCVFAIVSGCVSACVCV